MYYLVNISKYMNNLLLGEKGWSWFTQKPLPSSFELENSYDKNHLFLRFYLLILSRFAERRILAYSFINLTTLINFYQTKVERRTRTHHSIPTGEVWWAEENGTREAAEEGSRSRRGDWILLSSPALNRLRTQFNVVKDCLSHSGLIYVDKNVIILIAAMHTSGEKGRNPYSTKLGVVSNLKE